MVLLLCFAVAVDVVYVFPFVYLGVAGFTVHGCGVVYCGDCGNVILLELICLRCKIVFRSAGASGSYGAV